eukprot:IDg16412t1
MDYSLQSHQLQYKFIECSTRECVYRDRNIAHRMYSDSARGRWS